MRAIRSIAATGVLALVVGACSGTTSNEAPSAGGSTAAESAAASEPASTAQAGQTEVRWFCCLGGGDAPEQVEVEKQVVENFNASHPNIHLTFEAVPYAYFGQYSPAYAARKSIKNLDKYWGIPTLWALDK